MKYASEDLMNEHEGILHGLTILEKMIALVESGKTGMQNDIASMIDFLKLFADKCHHGKEEGILFPAMEKNGIPKERGPIGQMLSEHEEGRKFIRGLSGSIADGKLNTEAFIANGKGYIELLRSHIQKENTILFPMGDRAIPEDEQQQLLKAFENHEKTVMGEGIHEKLHAMLDEFSLKYK
jgi:hemerythrin-like domain-containing protein